MMARSRYSFRIRGPTFRLFVSASQAVVPPSFPSPPLTDQIFYFCAQSATEARRRLHAKTQETEATAREAEQARRLALAHQAEGNSLLSRKQYSDAFQNFSQALIHLPGETQYSIKHAPQPSTYDFHVPETDGRSFGLVPQNHCK